MAKYRIDGMPGVLVTAADSDVQWNGWDVPNATVNEYHAYSDAVLATGDHEVFRVMRLNDERVALVFPCPDSPTCRRVADRLEDGWHFHMEDCYTAAAADDDTPVLIDGLVWQKVEDTQDDDHSPERRVFELPVEVEGPDASGRYRARYGEGETQWTHWYTEEEWRSSDREAAHAWAVDQFISSEEEA